MSNTGGKLSTEDLADKVLNHSDELEKQGGAKQLAQKLGSDSEKGIPDASRVETNRKDYGTNKPKEKAKRTLFSFIKEAMKDKTLIILAISAVISIVLGVTVEDPSTGWIDGTAILVAVVIVVSVTAGNDYNKETKFQKLNEIRDDRKVTALRSGQKQEVSVFDLVVGDVVVLEAGDTIPADGVYISGQDVSVDESPMTGESDSVRKDEKEQPFLLSGCMMLEGVCHMLVIAVGSNSQWGKLSALLEGPSEDTPLTTKLEKLAENIGKAGLAAAFVLLAILVGKWLIAFLQAGKSWSWGELGVLVQFLISAISLIVVAVPEGLPLAVTISLAYSMMKMMKDQNLVRHLEACETMGGATNICSDKTGTLTENKMTVTKWWIAGNESTVESDAKSSDASSKSIKSSADSPSSSSSDKSVVDLVIEGICINSSAYLTEKDGKKEAVGNKTEGALLTFLDGGGLQQADKIDFQKYREDNKARVEKLFPFSSDNKMMSTLIKLDGKEGAAAHRLHTKGAAEIVVAACSAMVGSDGKQKEMDDTARSEMDKRIEQFASEGLRVIGLAYRDMSEVPHELDEMPTKSESSSSKKSVRVDAQGQKRGVAGIKDLTLIGLIGIKDPVREGVPAAVKDCQDAGIMVRMLTGDNILTAQAIARECGILTEGGVALEGPKFREMTDEETDKVLPKLQVLARMTPADKYKLVHRLRELGEVVAVTGDGVNDAPQLKEADVGFAMGSGTEVAKEACDIVLLDDNFASLVKAVMWGRNVYNSIRKFLQFQLTVNIVAVIVAFAGAVTSGESPLTPVQLLWVNLIMDTFAALALATEAPTRDLLKRKPYGRNDNLITRIMWRNIIGQVVFQLGVFTVLLYFPSIVPFVGNADAAVTRTFLFNTFVMCQLFNEINCRNLSNDVNVFRGFFSNLVFLGIMALTLVGQFLLVQFAGTFAETKPLSMSQWGVSIAIAFVTIPWGMLLRLVVRIKDKELERKPMNKEAMEKKAKKYQKGKGKEAKEPSQFEKLPLLEEGRQNTEAQASWKRAQRKLSVISAFRNAGRVGNVNYPSKAGQRRKSSLVHQRSSSIGQGSSSSVLPPPTSKSLNYQTL